MKSLWERFDNLIVFDVETTGVVHRRDEIIQLGALRLERGERAEETDFLVRLSPGAVLPSFITGLTGITRRQLEEEGLSKGEACRRIAELLDHERTLLAAYNAQFDLCFLYYMLQREGLAASLKGLGFLDAMTVYRDRRPYPHKLRDAVEAYELPGKNSHRALDDAETTLELLEAMAGERDDLWRYINLFGYNPRYGVSGARISSVRYLPQPYDAAVPLYETE